MTERCPVVKLLINSLEDKIKLNRTKFCGFRLICWRKMLKKRSKTEVNFCEILAFFDFFGQNFGHLKKFPIKSWSTTYFRQLWPKMVISKWKSGLQEGFALPNSNSQCRHIPTLAAKGLNRLSTRIKFGSYCINLKFLVKCYNYNQSLPKCESSIIRS